MDKLPFIGVTSVERPHFDGWFDNHHVYDCRSDASIAVSLSKGVPFILPVINDPLCIDTYIDTIDGLFITGGYDVFPGFYNEDTHVGNGNFYPKTDEFDMALLKAAMAKKMPILCVCRGMQIANVTYGGTLYQDIYTEKENVTVKHTCKESGDTLVHRLIIDDKDSLFCKATGSSENISVNSIHHQAIKDLAPTFKVVARSSDDIIEVIELKENSNQFFLGVQFHPEILAVNNHQNMKNIFDTFVRACKDYKENK